MTYGRQPNGANIHLSARNLLTECWSPMPLTLWSIVAAITDNGNAVYWENKSEMTVLFWTQHNIQLL